MPDAKIADRQTLRLQWSENLNGRDSAGLRKLEPDEIATLLKRGQALFETGDLAGARLLLQRAAEAGDPVAAMAIASTYDPVVLQDLGVRGFVADVGKARYWYEKAREFGSKEAPRRLESLASQGR
jgi:TPR repeat protein